MLLLGSGMKQGGCNLGYVYMGVANVISTKSAATKVTGGLLLSKP